MKLPGTEEWSLDAVSLRIAFERNVADASVTLLTETVAGYNFANPEEVGRRLPSDSIFALGRAAELAFAIENFELGFKICEEILVHDYTAPRTPLQFVFYATVGVLLRSFEVTCDSHGAFISQANNLVLEKLKGQFEWRLGRIVWPTYSSVQTAKLMRLLLPAIAASGLSDEIVQLLHNTSDERTIKSSVIAAVLASPEYEVIAAWQHSQVDFELLMGAIESLEMNYHRQLRLLRSDVYYWQTLRPKCSIIDWWLLALWVFIFRLGAGLDSLDGLRVPSK